MRWVCRESWRGHHQGEGRWVVPKAMDGAQGHGWCEGPQMVPKATDGDKGHGWCPGPRGCCMQDSVSPKATWSPSSVVLTSRLASSATFQAGVLTSEARTPDTQGALREEPFSRLGSSGRRPALPPRAHLLEDGAPCPGNRRRYIQGSPTSSRDSNLPVFS